MRRVRLVRGRHDQPIRLNRAVDLRDIAANDQPGRRVPWRLPLAQLPGALEALREQFLRDRDFPDVVELVVGERPADRLVINLHVRQQRQQIWLRLERVAQSIDLLAQFVDAILKRLAIGVRHCDPLGRDRPDLVGRLSAGPSARAGDTTTIANDSTQPSLPHKCYPLTRSLQLNPDTKTP